MQEPRIFPLLICLLYVSASSGQQDIPAYLERDPRLGESLNVTLVGSLQVEPPWDPEEGGFFTTADLYICGDYGYMGSNSGVLYVVDISTPQQMHVVAQVDMPGPALDVKVHEGLAVVAVQNGPVNEIGLVIVDVSDPPRSHILSTVQDEFWSGVHNVYLHGDRVYLAHSASRGLTVVDLSNPERPFVSGTWINQRPDTASIIHDIFIRGPLAFLSDIPRGTGGLVILDLADPDRPRTLATLPIEEGLHNCFPSGDLVYCNQELGGWQQALHIIDIADPSHPVEVATHSLKRGSVGGGIGPHNTWVEDGLLYWAFYDSGLRILDVHEPTRPVEIGYYRTPYAWSAQPHDDGLIYVADARLSSIRAFRFERPGFTVQEGSLERSALPAGSAHEFRVEALVEATPGSTGQLRRVTAHLLPDREVSWELHDDGSGDDLVAGDGLYTGRVVLAPELLSGEYHVEIRAEDDAGGVYPFSELPLKLFPVRDLMLLDDDLAISGSILHGDGGALPPAFTSTGPVLRGDRSVAFRVQPDNSLGWRVNLHFDDRLDFLGYKTLRFALHPGDARGQTLTLVLGEYNVRLVGRRSSRRINLLRDEWQIVEIPLDVFHRERGVHEVAFSGNLTGTFYVDDMRLVSQLQVPTLVWATHSTPGEVALQQNYPNPFNAQTSIPFRLPVSTRVELKVIDLLGQTVAVLADDLFPAGLHTVHWDGFGAAGQPLATGIYFYRLRAGDRHVTRRLLLLR